MRNRRLPGTGLAAIALGLGTLVGPGPAGGTAATPVYPYPDALWTAGYQCVEFSERYLYDRYGVTIRLEATTSAKLSSSNERIRGLHDLYLRN